VDDKIKVLIASVLKPADDVRSCYKIGQSLAQTNKYEVNIIGFDSKKKVETENIFLHPIFNFRRNSIKRLFAPYSILKKYIKLKPQLIIVNTPELLPVIYLIKIIFGTKIIYDIQENYQFNIKQNHIYKGVSKLIYLQFIKLIEGVSGYFVNGYFIAEESYENQLRFIHKKPYLKLLNKTILAIKQKSQPISFSKEQPIKFIYSGTIGREYGTLEAIEFCKKLRDSHPKITLIIIGYSPDFEYFKEVKISKKNTKFIQLKTQNKPIPQHEIVSEIEKSDIALLPYQLNPNISSRFPTKIYDYLAIGTPMIIPPQTTWKQYLDQYQAGICLNFKTPDLDKFQHEITSKNFYQKPPEEKIKWESQESILIKFIHIITSK